jgi:hypothetical protein
MQVLQAPYSEPVAVVRPVRVANRALLQLANSVIRGDPVRSLVELITNSDDSYRRMGLRNDASFGRIIVSLDIGSNTLTVLDFAEGIDEDQMDECVGTYGSDASGCDQGYSVRGFYGRGLKEAVVGLGSGVIRSIRDGTYVECLLTESGLYIRHNHRPASPEDFASLGIPYGRNGTKISIVMSKCRRVPNFNWLKYSLTNHTSLRDIVRGHHRRLILTDGYRSEILAYTPPRGKLLLQKTAVPIPGFDATFDISLYMSSRPLDQDGYTREGGVLIRSKNAVHEATLFKYDSNPNAAKIFGEIRCDYIEELMARGELIINDKRDGLDRHHPFTKSLRRMAEAELEPFVGTEMATLQPGVTLSDDLKRRLDSALSVANKLAIHLMRNSIRHTRINSLHRDGKAIQRSAEAPRRPIGEANGLKLSQLLFSGVKLNSHQDPRVRVYLDRSTGTINIATRSPSVAIYYGRSEDKGFLTLIAELICDIVFFELANICSDGQSERMYRLYNTFKNKYSHVIHKSVWRSPP